MKRKMIIGERIMYVDASTSLNCVFTVKIRGSFSIERLHAALGKIKNKHPLLHSIIKESGKRIPYLISSSQLSDIPVRMVERLSDEDWKTESKVEWGKLFEEKTAPLARVVWLRGAEVSELMLVCPHCICDGKSMVTLMRELLQSLDDPEKKLVAYPPFNSIEELLSEKYSMVKQIRARLVSVLALWFFFTKSRDKKSVSGNSYMLHWKLDAQNTAAITSACKRTETTVHAVLSVAFLEAFRLVKGESAKGNAVTPVDIRRFVPEIKEDMMFAMAPTVEVSVDREEGSDFWTKVKKLKEELTTKITGLNGRDSLMMAEYFPADKIIRYLKESEGTHDVTLSNMGRLGIAERYNSFEVETIYSPSVAFPWRNPNTVVISTFKGEMDFTFCSNDSFLDQEQAREIQESTVNLLLQGAEAGYAAV
jgi:NRPS condensation-like uncharacterized protein